METPKNSVCGKKELVTNMKTLSLLISIAGLSMTGCSESPVAHKEPPISARAMGASDGIMVFNTDSFDWPNTTIRIGPALDGYRRNVGVVKAGSSVAVSYSDCTKRDGRRFNQYTTGVETIYVMVDGYKGAAFNP